MVNAISYCIDALEVTNTAYQAFDSAPGWSCTTEQPMRPNTHASGNALTVTSQYSMIGRLRTKRQANMPMVAPIKPPKLDRPAQILKRYAGSLHT